MKFMCKYSGSVYEFTFEHDIKAMLTHPDYLKVDEEEQSAKQPAKQSAKWDRPVKKDSEE